MAITYYLYGYYHYLQYIIGYVLTYCMIEVIQFVYTLLFGVFLVYLGSSRHR